MPRSFVEVGIHSSPKLFDDLVGIMHRMGFQGFWEDGNTLRCYIEDHEWSPSTLAQLEKAAIFLSASRDVPPPRLTVGTVADRNWNEEWEKSITPIVVSKRIAICPSWGTFSPEPGQMVLTIDPKMSFGTGYHESTRLVLKLLEKHISAGMHVLDVGTGTGILAIASIKLGASTVLGIDNDDWAYANAVENVSLNGVHQSVTILRGELGIVGEGPFDLIAANIQKNVLLELLEGMKIRLTPGGILLLSGLLEIDESPMIDALHKNGFRMIEEFTEREWIAIAASLPKASD